MTSNVKLNELERRASTLRTLSLPTHSNQHFEHRGPLSWGPRGAKRHGSGNTVWECDGSMKKDHPEIYPKVFNGLGIKIQDPYTTGLKNHVRTLPWFNACSLKQRRRVRILASLTNCYWQYLQHLNLFNAESTR